MAVKASWLTPATVLLTDLDGRDVKIGMPVEMVTRKIRDDSNPRGIIVYGSSTGFASLMDSTPYGMLRDRIACKLRPAEAPHSGVPG